MLYRVETKVSWDVGAYSTVTIHTNNWSVSPKVIIYAKIVSPLGEAFLKKATWLWMARSSNQRQIKRRCHISDFNHHYPKFYSNMLFHKWLYVPRWERGSQKTWLHGRYNNRIRIFAKFNWSPVGKRSVQKKIQYWFSFHTTTKRFHVTCIPVTISSTHGGWIGPYIGKPIWNGLLKH